MPRLLLVLALCAGCGSPPVGRLPAAPAPRDGIETARLEVRDAVIAVEVVRTPAERAVGLMFRESLAPDSGMLFVFDTTRHLGFWMKNTLIPLDIAFADSDGVIVDIQRMAPLDTTTGYLSSAPARYAVEANLGWFASAGARVGDTIRGIPR
ncbi:MAG: DUF192 domain-containing protein [bacterium]